MMSSLEWSHLGSLGIWIIEPQMVGVFFIEDFDLEINMEYKFASNI